jgi:hypothetical protein
MDLRILWIAIACFFGALFAGIIGYLKAGGTWSWKVFAQTIYSGVGTAIVFAAAFSFSSEHLTFYDILAAVLAGMGVDNVVNRIVGAVRAKKAAATTS